MNIQEVRKVVGNIRASLFKNSNSYSIGMLKSHFKGTGLQFKEHQVYSHGDEVRFIDWKLTARMNTPYIKTFEEERNVEIVVVIDASQTMLYGYKNVSKLQASIELCCLLYLLAEETGDFIHAIILSDEVINVPKMKGEKGIANFISTLESKSIILPTGKINLKREIKEGKNLDEQYKNIMKHISRKREVVLLSDFNEFLDLNMLKRLVFRRNVHCFRVLSPLDETTKLPYSLYTNTSPSKNRGKLLKAKLDKRKDIEDFLGGRIKTLRVQNRYLEDFIKEMM